MRGQVGVGWAALLLGVVLSGCGKDGEPGAVSQPKAVEAATPAAVSDAVTGTTGGGAAQAMDEASPLPAVPRLDIAAEFHRTRVASGPGFWVLGELQNRGQLDLVDVRVELRLRDEAGEIVARHEDELGRGLAAGERTPVAVRVESPVAHESLELAATGVAGSEPAAALALSLEHDQPQRAELGGWFVTGRVRNDGERAVAGARLEVRGLDGEGRLLGLDWLELDELAPGEVAEFDVRELRYDEPPADFVLRLRPPRSPR